MSRATLTAPFDGRRLWADKPLVDSQQGIRVGVSPRSNKLSVREQGIQPSGFPVAEQQPDDKLLAPGREIVVLTPCLPRVAAPAVRRPTLGGCNLHSAGGVLESARRSVPSAGTGDSADDRRDTRALSPCPRIGGRRLVAFGAVEPTLASSLQHGTAPGPSSQPRTEGRLDLEAKSASRCLENVFQREPLQGMTGRLVLPHSSSCHCALPTSDKSHVPPLLLQQVEGNNCTGGYGRQLGYAATATTKALVSSLRSGGKPVGECSLMCVGDSSGESSSNGSKDVSGTFDGALEALTDDGDCWSYARTEDDVTFGQVAGCGNGVRFFGHGGRIREISRKVAYNNFLNEEDIPLVSTSNFTRRSYGNRSLLK